MEPSNEEYQIFIKQEIIQDINEGEKNILEYQEPICQISDPLELVKNESIEEHPKQNNVEVRKNELNNPTIINIHKYYKCDFCGKYFTQAGHLKNHVKTVHDRGKYFS